MAYTVDKRETPTRAGPRVGRAFPASGFVPARGRHLVPPGGLLAYSETVAAGAPRGVTDGRCWCVPQWALDPRWIAAPVLFFFFFGIASLTAVAVFRALVLVAMFLHSHISAV